MIPLFLLTIDIPTYRWVQQTKFYQLPIAKYYISENVVTVLMVFIPSVTLIPKLYNKI